MNEDQYRRRMALWFGSFPMIAVFVLLILVSLLSDRSASGVEQTSVASDPTHQADHSSKVMGHTNEPVPADSP